MTASISLCVDRGVDDMDVDVNDVIVVLWLAGWNDGQGMGEE